MKVKDNIRIVYIIFKNSKIKFLKKGRSNNSDLKFSDISVSRTHALINFKNGNFYLKDNHSKFGTLILIRSSLKLNDLENVALQVGSTIIQFKTISYHNKSA